MKTLTIAMTLIIAAFGLSACASNKPKTFEGKLEAKGYQLGESVERVKNYRINGFEHLDEYHVIFTAGPSRDYLVKTKVRCYELRTVQDLAFTTLPGGDLTRLDQIIVPTTTSPKRCPIDSIYKLEERDADAPIPEKAESESKKVDGLSV